MWDNEKELFIVICKLDCEQKQYGWMWTYKNNLHISIFCHISDVLSEAGAPCGIKSVCLYGGTKKEPQISALKSGVVR